MAVKYNLFFACTANICRSPIAQGLAPIIAMEYDIHVQVRSGGTMGLIGKPPAANSIKTMKKISIDISSQRSGAITPEDIAWADYMLVMSPKHAKILRARFPTQQDKILILAHFGGKTQIDDPVGKWIFSFHSCRKSIHKCLHSFFRELSRRPKA